MRAVACLLFILGLAAGRAVAQNPSDQPVTLDEPSGNAQPVTGEEEHQLSITGFGVGEYTYDGKTHDNSFAAGKVAVALFRELTDNLYVFGQLTTSISQEVAAARSRHRDRDRQPARELHAEVGVEPQPHLRHARRAGRLRARRRGAALHSVHLVQLRAGSAVQADRSVRRLDSEPESRISPRSSPTDGIRPSTRTMARPSALGSASSRRSARASA